MFEIRLKGEYIYMLKFEHLEGVFLEAKEHGYCVAIEVTIPGQEQTEFILNRAESAEAMRYNRLVGRPRTLINNITALIISLNIIKMRMTIT